MTTKPLLFEQLCQRKAQTYRICTNITQIFFPAICASKMPPCVIFGLAREAGGPHDIFALHHVIVVIYIFFHFWKGQKCPPHFIFKVVLYTCKYGSLPVTNLQQPYSTLSHCCYKCWGHAPTQHILPGMQKEREWRHEAAIGPPP